MENTLNVRSVPQRTRLVGRPQTNRADHMFAVSATKPLLRLYVHPLITRVTSCNKDNCIDHLAVVPSSHVFLRGWIAQRWKLNGDCHQVRQGWVGERFEIHVLRWNLISVFVFRALCAIAAKCQQGSPCGYTFSKYFTIVSVLIAQGVSERKSTDTDWVNFLALLSRPSTRMLASNSFKCLYGQLIVSAIQWSMIITSAMAILRYDHHISTIIFVVIVIVVVVVAVIVVAILIVSIDTSKAKQEKRESEHTILSS